VPSAVWQFPIVGWVYSSPALDAAGILHTGSTNGTLVFDYDAPAPIWTAPAIRPDRSLVVAERLGRVMLLGEG
jgi:hypothetical protein